MQKINKTKKINKIGYAVEKNLLNKNSLKQIKISIFHLLKKFLSKKHYLKNSLDEQLSYLRKNNKSKFGILFDSLQTLAINYEVLSNPKVLKKVAKLLNTIPSCITLTDVALRLDPPNDERNSLGWHQDSSYFRQNENGSNGLVLWTPVVYITKNMGRLEFLKDSHTLGPLRIKKKIFKQKKKSSQREINSKKLNNFKNILNYDLKLGDSLLMNMDMVHRSGKNYSKKFRISLIGRYHNMISKDFNSGLNIYKYTNKTINKEIHGR